MKKTYQTPVAEKVSFDYEENVTASNSNGISYATTDESNDWWTCNIRYDDAADVCGQDEHENSNPFWRCNIK